MALCQIHYLKPLADRNRSYAVLSRHRQTRRAVVFVHGFLGGPITTWSNFHTHIDQVNEGLDWWATSDLFFFQYPSADNSIGFFAADLLKFLRDYLPLPPDSLFASDSKIISAIANVPEELPVSLRTALAYESLMLVGHSQGAVVLRQAILDAIDVCRVESNIDSPSPFYQLLFDANLCLFAPAHTGAQLSGLPGIVAQMPLVTWPFEVALRGLSKSYIQLQAHSDFLKRLESRTVQAWKTYHFRALSARIIYGEKEGIVTDLNYDHDLSAEYENGQSHTSICKPQDGYTKPMDFIRNAQTRQVSAVHPR